MYSENDLGKRKERKWGVQAIADIARAVVILSVAFVLLLGTVLKIAFVLQIDSFLRYGFGGISLLYGSFRLYRGVRQ